jgi:hypothetical protein
MYPVPLVADNVELPTLSTDRFALQPLGPEHLDIDYEAIQATGDHLDGAMLPPGWLGDVQLFRIEDDVIELHWHRREFRTRASFAYVAVEHSSGRSLGCAYVNPTDRIGYDAEVTVWGRWLDDEPDWDAKLFALVRHWVMERWPFDRPAFPGRIISWDDWLALPAKAR